MNTLHSMCSVGTRPTVILKSSALQTVSRHGCKIVPGSLRCTKLRALTPQSEPGSKIDVNKFSEMMLSQPMDEEQKYTLEQLAGVLQVPIATVRNMVFKKRGLINMDAQEVKSKLEQIAKIVDVPVETARQMVVIQPGLLFDTEKQAEALQYGIRAICYDLNAPKEEVVELILKNQSVLHGRQMHLSVADMAHLSMLREPKGRIVD